MRKPTGSCVKRAECSLTIGTVYRVQVFSLMLASSVGLWVGIQSAKEWVLQTPGFESWSHQRRGAFNSEIVYLCQSININNNKYVCMYLCIFDCMHLFMYLCLFLPHISLFLVYSMYNIYIHMHICIPFLSFRERLTLPIFKVQLPSIIFNTYCFYHIVQS